MRPWWPQLKRRHYATPARSSGYFTQGDQNWNGHDMRAPGSLEALCPRDVRMTTPDRSKRCLTRYPQ